MKTPKVPKQVVKTFEVEGDVVTMTQVEVRRAEHASRSDGHRYPLERSRFEVRINGVLRGHVRRPNGVAQPYAARALHSGQNPALRDPVILYGHKDRDYDTCNDLADVAAIFHEAYKQGRTPTPEEVTVLEGEYQVRKAAEDAEQAATSARHEAERAKRVHDAEQYRTDTIEGLTSMRDRMRGTITNFEMIALERAIARFTN